MPTPTVGLTEVDTLITRAIELGLKFPPDVKRWALLAWAAEALELKRQNPASFERDGLRAITKRVFPTVNP
jgi:hypothetical protein